ICAFGSLATITPDEIEKHAAHNPGAWAWRDSPGACLDLMVPPPTWVPDSFRASHPWLAHQVRVREIALRTKPSTKAPQRASRYDVYHNSEPCELDFLRYRPKKVVNTLHDLATRKCAWAYPDRAIFLWEQYFT
uniref:hypothetical protein n=1 Tax=Escherichia coli TaxID=562 RepID=UPI003C2DA187